mmetsp:Transcript_12449/g.36659  ORF Transcript_12449/g.36659 Transcript_12449/m.36659 type:complete len:231 (-) Transcript_12449:373-1065(-)
MTQNIPSLKRKNMVSSARDATPTNLSACVAVRSTVSSSAAGGAPLARSPGHASPLRRPREPGGMDEAMRLSLAVATHEARATAVTPKSHMRTTDGSKRRRGRSAKEACPPSAAAATSARASSRRRKTAGTGGRARASVPRFMIISSSGRQQMLRSSPLRTRSLWMTPAAAHAPDGHMPAHLSAKPRARARVAASPSGAAMIVEPAPQSTAQGSARAKDAFTSSYALATVL